ncbi:MFS transporter [Bacillus sp. Marseille-P3661]|uniref:MFS transporter n=1 Tax=Bacillus sp. Marseille-P3661 TaxID=1936234 RepID=UPI000C83ADE3|nr:MFS transporter [Bacillus sp. Marseille-P3661]
MRKNYNSYLIFTSTSLFLFSIAGSRPLIPLFSSQLGANNVQIGLIVSLFSLLPLFLSIKLGKVVDRVGSKVPLAIGITLGGFSLGVPWFFHGLGGIYVSQILSGFSQVLYVISMQAYIGGFSKSKVRNHYINIFSVSVAFGSFIGPLISGFFSENVGYSMTLALLGFILLLSSPLSLLFKKKSLKGNLERKEEKNKSIDLLSIPGLRKAFLISAIVLLSKDIYIAFFPLLAESKGISTSVIGLIIAVNSLAGIFIRVILPLLVQRFNQSFIITISIIAVGFIYLLNPLFSNEYILGALSFILGLCMGVGQPLSISSSISLLPDRRVGEGLGLRLSINKFTQVIVPVFLGLASSVVGIGGVFYLSGLLIITSSIEPKRVLGQRDRSGGC